MEREGVVCPNCESIAVNVVNPYGTLSVIMFLTAGVGMWIPVLGWMLVPVALLLGIVLIVPAFASKQRNAVCKTCNHTWKVEK